MPVLLDGLVEQPLGAIGVGQGVEVVGVFDFDDMPTERPEALQITRDVVAAHRDPGLSAPRAPPHEALPGYGRPGFRPRRGASRPKDDQLWEE